MYRLPLFFLLLAACSAPQTAPETVTRTYDFEEVTAGNDLVAPEPVVLIEPAAEMSPEAALLLKAEAFFEQNDMQNALRMYEAVAQGGDENIVSFARYKLAWVHYNLGEFGLALEYFVTFVGSRDADGQPTALAKEALRDTVLAFSEVGDPEKAPAFYKQIAPKNWRKQCDRLLMLYEAQGKVEDAEALKGLLD